MIVNAVISVLAGVFFLGLVLVVSLREKFSVARLSLGLGVLILGAESLMAARALFALMPEDAIFWLRLRFLVFSFIPGAWLVFSLTFARGNYKVFLHRWKPLLAFFIIIPPLLALVFLGTLIIEAKPVTGASDWLIVLGIPGALLNIIFIPAAGLVLMNLERTLKASVGIMRWKIKYMILGVGTIFAVRIYISSQTLLFSACNLSLEGLNAGALLLGGVFMLRSLLRARLISVDLYLSHSALYRSISIILAGIYLLAVGVLAKVVSIWGVDTGFPLTAFLVFLALIAFSVVILSERIRQKVRGLIIRYFGKPQYDYRRVWAAFTNRTGSIMDIHKLCQAVAELVSETFQALATTLWLVDDQQRDRLVFGGSTSISSAQARDLVEPGEQASELVAILRQHESPVDIDETKEAWVEELKRLNPHYFKVGGHRVCVPLAAAGEVLGLMIVGDRVNFMPYSQEEFNLLKTIGDQVAASLLNLRLSDRLLESKEFEAYQAMSTFFVHDLKNTASTLSLMLQNLPRHFGDPAFREDALKAMSKSVDKINDLIRRLTMLRQDPEMHLEETDLNEIVRSASAGFNGSQNVRLTTRLESIPKVSVDSDQIQKVVTNLILNASEAVGTEGEVRIATQKMNEWIMLSVSDNGCGMSPEFMDRSLFRPFQTTKKEGMGIGLFHSKRIVEAHHGKIEAESNVGKGTTIRVWLPLEGRD